MSPVNKPSMRGACPPRVNGFLYVVASEYAKEKNQAPFPEDFHTYTTEPVIPATRLLFQ